MRKKIRLSVSEMRMREIEELGYRAIGAGLRTERQMNQVSEFSSIDRRPKWLTRGTHTLGPDAQRMCACVSGTIRGGVVGVLPPELQRVVLAR